MAQLADATVIEVAVPVGRAVAGRRGVQTGPAVGNLLTFLALQVWIAAIGRQATAGRSVDDDPSSRLDRSLDRTIFSGARRCGPACA